MSEELLKSIDEKLSNIIKLLAVNAIKERSESEQMEFLKNLGMNSSEIGTILGKSSANVRVQLSRKRKRGVKKE